MRRSLALGMASLSFAHNAPQNALQTAPGTPALSPIESRMAATIDANSAADRALLEQLVNINSGTMHLAGVVAVKDVLAPRLQALGFQRALGPDGHGDRSAPATWWPSIHVRQAPGIAASGCCSSATWIPSSNHPAPSSATRL